MAIDIKQSLREVLDTDKELFFAIRVEMESKTLTLETNVDKSDVGHVFFRPLVVEGDMKSFEYSVEIVKSLFEALKGLAGEGIKVNNKIN